jgi:hypothetical protein
MIETGVDASTLAGDRDYLGARVKMVRSKPPAGPTAKLCCTDIREGGREEELDPTPHYY